MIGFFESIISFFESTVHHVQQFFDYLEYFTEILFSSFAFPNYLAAAFGVGSSSFNSLGAIILLSCGVGSAIILFNIVRDLL